MFNEDCCGTCRFGLNQEQKMYGGEINYQTICRYNPVPITKQSTEWCGRHEEDPAKTQKKVTRKKKEESEG